MTADQPDVQDETSRDTRGDIRSGIKRSRFRVPRSRGALSGVVLLVLGAWTALIAFVGPYFNFAFTPAPNDAWHWTASRGWLELLPGVAAFVAGLMLLAGTHRVSLTFASWLGVASGAWLVVGPVLAPRIGLNAGSPDPGSNSSVQTVESLLFYYALGAAILFFAATALGRLSVHSVRDVRAAQRRVDAEAARDAEERRLAEQRVAEQQAAQQAAERDRRSNEAATAQPTQAAGQTSGGYAPAEEADAPRHERPPGEPPNFAPTGSYPTQSYPTQQMGPTQTQQPPRT